jgi:pimeloyl-ACP methyl ester carboxylesterase
MAAGYAREMAARGVLALAFDFRSWGQSGGQPRSMEDPYAKAADIVAAAKFLAAHPAVDADAIGGLAICAGSSYLALAATEAPQIKSLAFVAPALPTRADVLENLGGETAMDALVDAARDAMAAYESTGRQTLVPAVDESAGEAADYYTNADRGRIPEWDNTFNLASWSTWAQFDVHSVAARLDQPLLVVHSDAAVNPDSVREFVAKVPGPVEQLWLDGVTQFDFYDQPDAMTTASDAVSAHFGRTLG